jgi:hypothetical protein
MVCLSGVGGGARRGRAQGGGGTGATDVEAATTLVQRRDGGQDREWRREKGS